MKDTASLLEAAMGLQINEKYAEAEDIYRQILKEQPGQPDALHLLGLVRDQQKHSKEALELIEKAISLLPKVASFHHNIAGIYRKTGQLEKAEEGFREAIRLKADYAEAYQGLAEMVRFEKGDPFIEILNQQLSNSKLSKVKRSYLNFAAGKYFDDIGDFVSAFKHYEEGNRNASKTYDSAHFSNQVKEMLYVYDSKYLSSLKNTGDSSDLPVFVVGMPRSGTSLVEQILASHSTVYGAGELNDIKRIVSSGYELSTIKQAWPNFLPGLDKSHLKKLASEYLRRISVLNPDASITRVVDKHPLNFQFIGLILGILPQASIIHTIRHPLDTCLSCFFQNFSRGQEYSFDIKKLGFFYRDYRRIMEHWDQCFPGKILHVHYESLINNQEAEIRRMLDHCNLAFEPACLEFYKTEREIQTASFLQVRKPIYKTSKGRWRNYLPQLQELADIIDYPLEEPVTISKPDRVFYSHEKRGRGS